MADPKPDGASAAAAPSEPSGEDMKANYGAVLERIRAAHAASPHAARPSPRLVAVSKLKSASCVADAYAVAGVRCFGENYVQELCEKAAALAGVPEPIRWHFIGHLQSNKASELVRGVPTLAVVETVDNIRLAEKLDRAVAQHRPPGAALSVFVQVNTSGEESKSGTNPGADTVALCRAISDQCPRLRVAGLMTIGMPDYTSRPENFACLVACRKECAAALGVAEDALELSMGMSGDFEAAVAMGATNVRVGSSIFGARPVKASSPPAAAVAAVSS